jgi:dihydroorotate dehydrogenase (NAD+) catalytic subunit
MAGSSPTPPARPPTTPVGDPSADPGSTGVELDTTIGSVELPSPIMTAAGTAGHGAELGAYLDLSRLGALVVKSLAHYPWAGNPAVRVHATPAGMINSVGLQGPGIERWLADELPELREAGARVVASLWGRTVDDYRRGAEMLAAAGPEVIAVEVNISCPNTEAGNELFSHSPHLTEEALRASGACGRPRWAKLSPNAGPVLVDVAAAAVAGGAEAVTLVNTYFGLSIDTTTGRPHLGAGRGGVSGPAIRPLAVRAVADVHAALPEVPIIGVGGISTASDIVEFAMVGASAVQIGTATLADPRACQRLGADLVRWCANQNVQKFRDVIGTAHLT